MSSTSQFWNRSQRLESSIGLAAEAGVRASLRRCLEWLWLGVTFLLFIFLGPFAAIAVVPAVFSLALQCDGVEPEREVNVVESY